jgi:hypothetical protein
MARDKLITIRIEGEKREAFNNLAKSQNTDTASLLYDFINQCLSGRIDISLVTGKKQWIDKIDNQIGSDRIDKLETDTQRIDERLDIIAKKLNDWVEAFDDRLNDCDQGLGEKITSLENRLNALAIQLDSQQIDKIDTDSQQIDDMEPLLKREREASITSLIPNGEPSPFPTIEETVESAIDKVEAVTDTVEAVDKVDTDSTIEPVTGSIGPVPGDSIEPVTGEGMNAAQAYRYLTEKGVKVSEKTLSNWVKIKQIPVTGKGDKVSEYLVLRGKLYYPKID